MTRTPARSKDFTSEQTKYRNQNSDEQAVVRDDFALSVFPDMYHSSQMLVVTCPIPTSTITLQPVELTYSVVKL
jgi:hypothetical protein